MEVFIFKLPFGDLVLLYHAPELPIAYIRTSDTSASTHPFPCREHNLTSFYLPYRAAWARYTGPRHEYKSCTASITMTEATKRKAPSELGSDPKRQCNGLGQAVQPEQSTDWPETPVPASPTPYLPIESIIGDSAEPLHELAESGSSPVPSESSSPNIDMFGTETGVTPDVPHDSGQNPSLPPLAEEQEVDEDDEDDPVPPEEHRHIPDEDSNDNTHSRRRMPDPIYGHLRRKADKIFCLSFEDKHGNKRGNYHVGYRTLKSKMTRRIRRELFWMLRKILKLGARSMLTVRMICSKPASGMPSHPLDTTTGFLRGAVKIFTQADGDTNVVFDYLKKAVETRTGDINEPVVTDDYEEAFLTLLYDMGGQDAVDKYKAEQATQKEEPEDEDEAQDAEEDPLQDSHSGAEEDTHTTHGFNSGATASTQAKGKKPMRGQSFHRPATKARRDRRTANARPLVPPVPMLQIPSHWSEFEVTTEGEVEDDERYYGTDDGDHGIRRRQKFSIKSRITPYPNADSSDDDEGYDD